MNHQHDKLFQDETHSKAFHFSTRNTRNAVKHVDYQVFHFFAYADKAFPSCKMEHGTGRRAVVN